MKRITLVGCDTSHSVHFTEIFNDPSHPEHVPGGRIVAAIPGGFGAVSPELESLEIIRFLELGGKGLEAPR